MDTLVSNKSISISSHRHRMYQLSIMEKWGNENGYTGISIREMGGREFYAKLQRMEGSINKVLKRIGRELGIDKINPHMARHSATVHLLSAGLDITTVAYLLGHSNTNQIERTYGGFLKDYKAKKAEMAAHVLDCI